MKTLLVGLSNPATAEELVRLADRLARSASMEIVLIHVVTVANQIGLTTARSSPEVIRARDMLQEVTDRARRAGIEPRALVEVARSVEDGLLAAADSHEASSILVGYTPPAESVDASSDEDRFDRAMYRVARRAEADVVVAKLRSPSRRRILVTLAREAPLEPTGFVARAMAEGGGTAFTFLHVCPPGEDRTTARLALEERLRDAGLADLGSVEIVEADDPVEAILSTADDHDLVILGPSGRPRLLDVLFSSRARTIADGLEASVILVWGPTEEG